MTWLLLFVLAAGPFVSIETESASISGNVEVKTDSTASAGSYLSFGTTSTGGGGNYGGLSLPVVGPRALSCNGVTINPGDNIQSKVTASPTGTTFCIKAGTHKRQSVKPKDNDKFIGEKGAILDGEKATTYAFEGSGINGVTISNLVIKNYSPGWKEGMIDRGSPGASGWIVEYSEISDSAETGVRAGSSWKVRHNHIHHNQRYAQNGTGTNLLVEYNEMNNNCIMGASGDCSNTKVTHSDGLIWRGNYVHDNDGNGLWTDINNINVLVEENIAINNSRSGIFHEISCKATIRNNYLENNGSAKKNGPDDMAGANGIAVSNSPDVEIYGNTLVNNYKGIGSINWEHNNRVNVNKCVPSTKNLYVHDNTITHEGPGAVAGLSRPLDPDTFYGTARFRNNTYNVDSSVRWSWKGSLLTYTQWKALGQN
jgi:hypothetical protein